MTAAGRSRSGVRGAGRTPCALLYPHAPQMGLAAVITFSLCLWVALWSTGVKALDGMLLALAIIVVAAGIKMLSAYLPGHRS